MRSFLIFLLLGLPLLAKTAEELRDVQLTIDTAHKTAEFDPRNALGAGIDGHWQGETLKMFSPGSVQEMLGAGLGPISVRLRTELAVEAWHWNPRGRWSDSGNHQGYWISEAHPDRREPILLSYGYKLPRRGDTLDEANDDGYSMLDDDDPATFWKSNPYLARPYTGEPDAEHPQWVVLDFGKLVPVNEIRIHWANPYARKFVVEYSRRGRVYFGGHPRGVWKRFPYGEVTKGGGGEQELKLSGQPVTTRYLRIWMTEGSGTAEPVAEPRDLRDSLGYAIREISAGVRDAGGKFHDEVSHARGHEQTVTYASSTDPWHRESDRDPKVEQPGVDLIARCGITRGLPLMLAVPVFYDTPENAAALASYVRERGIPVSRYELGEEPDGQRVAPCDFGVLYAESARLLRKIAPQGILGGPSFVTVDVDHNDDTYRFDHRWWLADFRRELTRQGERGDFQFLSFEWYPFDDVEGSEARQLPLSAGMLARAMARLKPVGIPLVIGEANYSVFPCRQEVDLGGGLLNAEVAAQFLCGGGSAMYYYGYEPNKLEESSGSWGNQMMLLQRDKRKSAIPLATFHALRLLTSEWLDPHGGKHTAYSIRTSLPSKERGVLSAFALKRLDGTWALLVINKDTKRAVKLSLKQSGGGPVFCGPCRLATYSGKEYSWHAEGVEGHPVRNEPPSRVMVEGDQPIILPPWSISVLKGR